ncbi:hypothetical protein [Phenylobacterium sp.]|uniref:EF-hand domain-containing protein n=1 Tax=Phenylobacterium sp. TaxID=1871053 RepID=UPI00301CBE24
MNRFLIAAVVAPVALLATSVAAQPGRGPDPDADRDGKVTLAEFKAAQAQRTDRLFARLDADKDGRITQAEIDAVAKGRPGGRGGGQMLMRLDADKDGAVTRAEMNAGAERRFQAADANKDGWLSKDELRMMQQRMRGPAPK